MKYVKLLLPLCIIVAVFFAWQLMISQIKPAWPFSEKLQVKPGDTLHIKDWPGYQVVTEVTEDSMRLYSYSASLGHHYTTWESRDLFFNEPVVPCIGVFKDPKYNPDIVSAGDTIFTQFAFFTYVLVHSYDRGTLDIHTDWPGTIRCRVYYSPHIQWDDTLALWMLMSMQGEIHKRHK